MSLLSDNLPSQDLLGRQKFAKQIVTSLTKVYSGNTESFVIGINGSWGSGKSTLLTFIEEELKSFYKENPGEFKIIKFNPWANSSMDTDDLERDFLETIITELESIKWKKNIEEKNNKFKSYLKYLNYLKFAKHIHPVAEKLVDAIEDYTNQSSVHSIEEVKKQADELIKEQRLKLFIFLDDLDRLTPSEITSIFRVIKLNANFLNTCFIVAYDKKIVIRALDSSFNNSGEDYLEKIIQVDFSVPEIMDENMEVIFISELKKLILSLQIHFDEDAIIRLWKYYGLKEYFRTLRDIKRYVNSLIFSFPNITQEINFSDFIVLEAIKVFDFTAYQKVYDDFILIQRKAVWGASAFDQSTINEYKNPTTRSLLDFLFVQKGTMTQLLMGSVNAKNLYDPEFFPRYYTLYIPSKDVNNETLVQFLTIGKNREQLLRESLQKGKIKNLLKRLSDADLKNYYAINDINILEAFLKFWDNHENSITSELDEYIWHSYFNLAHSLKDQYNAAKTAISNLILNENNTQPIRFVFNYFIILFNKEGRSDRAIREKIAEQIDIALPEMEKAFVKSITKQWSSYIWRISSGNSNFVSHLFLTSFAKYAPKEYQEALEKNLDLPNFTAFLLNSYFVIRNQKNELSMLDLSKKDLLLPPPYWDRFFINLTDAKPGTWNEHDRQAIDFFLKSYLTN